MKILHEMCTWDRSKTFNQLAVGSRCIDEQYIEPEKAQEREDDQHNV
jgi:hypothetical protein